MKTLKLSWALFAFTIVLASCKKDSSLSEQETRNRPTLHIEAKDLIISAGFNFDAEKTLNVRVKVTDGKAGERFAIRIYADVPASGKIISTGLTNAYGEYEKTVRIPSWQEFIYIEKIDPNGSSKFEKVKANQFASALFTNGQTLKPYIIRKSSGMDCTTGCTVTYNNPSSNITVHNGGVACITGTISSAINITVDSGGIAKICASGNLNEVHVNTGGQLYILENAIITLNSFIDFGGKFANYSDSLIATTDFDFYGDSEAANYGKVYGAGVKVLNGVFTNNGYIYSTTSPVFIWGSPICKFINNNYVSVRGLFITDQGVLENNCYFRSTFFAENNADIINNGLLKIDGDFKQISAGSLVPSTKMNNGALLSVDELQLYHGTIDGGNSTRSKIKVATTTTINVGTSITGNTDICDTDGIETNLGTILSPALSSCAGYIAPSTCNPEGFGTQNSQDSDNDGVADAQDEYPNDASRAFNSYYPTANTMATVAFEDLWPAKADYDFNDLSILFNIQQVLNADNKVVDYKVVLKVKAVGGSFDNGFGFQLDDLLPSDISTVSGQILVNNLITRNANNTEASQNKAVIIVYDTPEPTLHRDGSSMFNTIKNNPTATSDSIHINITFTTPIQDSKLSIDKFNPFIFTNQRREYEVHLANFKPTNLANALLFGTFEDRTNISNNTYYKNANGMPWAILIPEEFAHPTEKTPITLAYNFFDDWAVSGGSAYTNWHINSPGNRNANYIY